MAVQAFLPEPAWQRKLRPYATILLNNAVMVPISQAILRTSADVMAASSACAGALVLSSTATVEWWWPTLWWGGLLFFCRGGLMKFFKSSALCVLGDVMVRGRTQWVEQATEAGAIRAEKPLLQNIAFEATAGVAGSLIYFEFVRSTVGGSGSVSWRILALGMASGAVRGVIVADGGHLPSLQTACGCLEFVLGVTEEHECLRSLGFAGCSLKEFLPMSLFGCMCVMPLAVLLMPLKFVIECILGEDPIVAQRAVLDEVLVELGKSNRAHEALSSARQRVVGFTGKVELASLWQTVRRSCGSRELARAAAGPGQLLRASSGSLKSAGAAAQKHLDALLAKLVAHQRTALTKLMHSKSTGTLTQQSMQSLLIEVLSDAAEPIVLRRREMVRSALTQIAEKSVVHLLLGIGGGRDDPSLESVSQMLGFHVSFVGEEGLDMGGVRRDFMDSFATALTREEHLPLSLSEPLEILGLGADSTWRPVPCDEEHQSFLWAFGRFLALALVYRCPCPIPLSLSVFKCLLGIRLRPGDVRQLDPDFWKHRMQPLLQHGGAEIRQAQLRDWGMDPLTFTSIDGCRELKPNMGSVLVMESNREEYAQLLCEDFLIGSVRTEIGCLVMGFHEVVPQELLKGLDAEQLRMLVCGVAQLDVDEWEAHAVVADSAQQLAKWFFDWLRKQPQETRAKILAFVTGSSVLPSGWEGLRDQKGAKLPFRILAEGEPESLPSAHTCVNLLVLPPVTSRATLERRLDCVVEFAGREMLLI